MDTGCLYGVGCCGIHKQQSIHTYAVPAGLEEHRSLRWSALFVQKHKMENNCIISRLQVWRYRAGTIACRVRWVDASHATAALAQITHMQLTTTKIHTFKLMCSICKGLHVDTSLLDQVWDNSSPKVGVQVAALAQNAGQHRFHNHL